MRPRPAFWGIRQHTAARAARGQQQPRQGGGQACKGQAFSPGSREALGDGRRRQLGIKERHEAGRAETRAARRALRRAGSREAVGRGGREEGRHPRAPETSRGPEAAPVSVWSRENARPENPYPGRWGPGDSQAEKGDPWSLPPGALHTEQLLRRGHQGEMPSGPVLILTFTVFMIKGLEIVVYLGLRLPPPPV